MSSTASCFLIESSRASRQETLESATEPVDVGLSDSGAERGRVSIVATQSGNLANRQTGLLVDPHRNGGLSPPPAARPGREHALPAVQLPATSTVVAMWRARLSVALRRVAYIGLSTLVALQRAALIDALAERISPIEPDRLLNGDIRTAADVLDRFTTRETEW